jgi:predicted nuclease of predicted toxin-antitoxin system
VDSLIGHWRGFLLVDMNLSPHWVDQLHAAGLPAVHWLGIGRMDAPDVEIMAYAAKYDYVVLTHDLDFSAIRAATQGTKPSVVQMRADNISAAVIGEPPISALQQMAPELPAGALLTVDPGRTRLHAGSPANAPFPALGLRRRQMPPHLQLISGSLNLSMIITRRIDSFWSPNCLT